MKILKLLLVFLPFMSFSQTLKLYNGTFAAKDGRHASMGGIEGTAKYQYYENEYFERIYDGKFELSFSMPDRKIFGTYSKNKKTGLWRYEYINHEFNYFTKKDEIYGKDIITGQFKEGYRIGKWTLIGGSTNDVVTHIYSEINYSSENKLNGLFIFKLNPNDKNNSLTVVGFYDKNGLKDSTWKIDFKDFWGIEYWDERHYKNGVLVFEIFKKNSTGEILKHIDIQNGINIIANDDDNRRNENKHDIDKAIKFCVSLWLNKEEEMYNQSPNELNDGNNIVIDYDLLNCMKFGEEIVNY